MTQGTIKLLGIQAGSGGRVKGAEAGPWWLRKHGLDSRLAACGHTVEDLGDIPGVYETRFALGRGRAVNYLHNILQVNRHTHACVLGTLRKAPDAFLLVIGGDHSLAIGTLAGLSDSCERLGLLWIDAHADFNTPHSSPSGNIHGMSLAVACGHGLPDLRAIASLDPMVREEDVVLLGCRDVDPGEREQLARSGVRVCGVEDWRRRGVAGAAREAVESLASRCDHVHLSFDIDVLDPRHVPGTGTPVEGGLERDEALELLQALGETGTIRSAEFVEFNPKLDLDGRTGKLLLDLIEALLRPSEASDAP